MKYSSEPIGIFDSGVGGLTVAKAVVKHLPKENIIYFGDTAHFPYGDKSAAAIRSYAIKITNMFLQRRCKLILIACNSASAAAYDVLHHTIGDQIPIVNVLDPVIDFVCENYDDSRVGLIGTRHTVDSSIYSNKIKERNKNIILKTLATPLLASAIEEGFSNHKIIDDLLEEYLSRPALKWIEALILGCTHYPVIKDRIARFYGKRVNVIDGTDIVARFVKQLLVKRKLLNKQKNEGSRCFYISDLTQSFEERSQLFFGKKITLECYSL